MARLSIGTSKTTLPASKRILGTCGNTWRVVLEVMVVMVMVVEVTVEVDEVVEEEVVEVEEEVVEVEEEVEAVVPRYAVWDTTVYV